MTKKKTEPAETEREAFHRRITGNEATAEDKRLYRKQLDENPDYIREVLDFSNMVVEEVLKTYMYSSFATRECFRYKIREMREDLGWPHASKAERLLIEQICVTWLKLNIIERSAVSKLREPHTKEIGLYWQKTLESAQRRHLRAVESLVRVRKFLAEAEFRQAQADEKRARVAEIAGRAVKQLTAGAEKPINAEAFKRAIPPEKIERS